MIRIFVGTPANNEDLESQAVLEYSLRKYASEPIDLTWMKLSNDPNSFWYSTGGRGWNSRGWATPFSGFRWGIPAHCNFEGRAIYLDIDMIARDDIAKLWNQDIKGNAFCIAKDASTFCTTLWDCAKAKPHLPPIKLIKEQYALYANLRRRFPADAVQRFEDGQNWNCLDGENYRSVRDPEIKILHCTSIPHQPQLRYAVERLKAKGAAHWSANRYRPLPHWRPEIIELFDEVLAEAIAAGYAPEKYEATTFGKYNR